jgi:hypothetical protein
MRFNLSRLAAAAMAVTASGCTEPDVDTLPPSVAQSGLTPQMETSLEGLAGQIQATADAEGALVESYEWLENFLDGPPPRTNMVVISLLHDEGSLPELRIKKRTDVDTESDEALTDDEISMLRELFGEGVAVLTVEPGSTRWCVYALSRKKCYRYPPAR